MKSMNSQYNSDKFYKGTLIIASKDNDVISSNIKGLGFSVTRAKIIDNGAVFKGKRSIAGSLIMDRELYDHLKEVAPFDIQMVATNDKGICTMELAGLEFIQDNPYDLKEGDVQITYVAKDITPWETVKI